MSDLENLRAEDLYALARNPASVCKAEAVGLLRAMGSPLAKHFDAVSVQTRTTPTPELPKPPVPANPTEAIAILGQFPVDRLMDIVSSESVYPKTIRLEAARLVKQRSPLNRYAREQSANVSAAANTPTFKQTEGIAQHATHSFTNQFDQKVALRMNNESEFARMMKAVE